MILGTDRPDYFTGNSQYGSFQNVVSKGYNASIYGDIYLTGFFYILWTRLPDIMKDNTEELGNFKEMTRVLNNAVQLPGRELQFTEVTTGFGGASKLAIPTMISNGNDLSITYNELSGLPMLKFNQRWITAIRDPISGLSDIPNYGLKTYTGDILYITTKPVHYKDQGSMGVLTGSFPNEQIVESAHLFTNVFPTNDPQELLSATIEASDKIDVQINYKFANMWNGEEARKFASSLLDSMIKVKDMGTYKVGPDGSIDSTLS